MKLTHDLRVLRVKLINTLHEKHPERPYMWAIEEGCRIVRETVAEFEAAKRGTPAAAAGELTADDFAEMPAGELAARILRAS